MDSASAGIRANANPTQRRVLKTCFCPLCTGMNPGRPSLNALGIESRKGIARIGAACCSR
jgi:hypothetical protein